MKDICKVSWEGILLCLSDYGMLSVFIVLVVVKFVDYMSLVRILFFKINWRVIIGVCLVFIIVLVYYLLMLSGMEFCEFCGYLEWEGKIEGIFYCEEVFFSGGCFIVLFFYG